MKINSIEKTVRRGFSMIEMIVYIAVLAMTFAIVINTVISFASSYREITALRATEYSATAALERMTREIRAASSVDMTNSILNSNPGTLTLIKTVNGVSTTTKFYVASSTLKVDINNVYSGPLTASNAAVTSLVFTVLTSGNSTAVKIDMTVVGRSNSVTKTKNYHSTIILKGI